VKVNILPTAALAAPVAAAVMVVPLLVLLFLAKATLVDLERETMSEMAAAVKALLAATQAVLTFPETAVTGNSQASLERRSGTQAVAQVSIRLALLELRAKAVKVQALITAAVAQRAQVAVRLDQVA
jgi:hypothetical protein